MIFKTKSVTLKNNISAIFRAPTPEDSVQMLEYLKTTAAETEFVIRYPTNALRLRSKRQNICRMSTIRRTIL